MLFRRISSWSDMQWTLPAPFVKLSLNPLFEFRRKKDFPPVSYKLPDTFRSVMIRTSWIRRVSDPLHHELHGWVLLSIMNFCTFLSGYASYAVRGTESCGCNAVRCPDVPSSVIILWPTTGRILRDHRTLRTRSIMNFCTFLLHLEPGRRGRDSAKVILDVVSQNLVLKWYAMNATRSLC